MNKHNCEEKDLMILSNNDENFICCSVCGKELTKKEVRHVLMFAVIPDINNTYYN